MTKEQIIILADQWFDSKDNSRLWFDAQSNLRMQVRLVFISALKLAEEQESEKRQIMSPEFYDEEQKWFPELETKLSTEKSNLFFDYIMNKYKISGWSIKLVDFEGCGIGVCNYNEQFIIVGNNPYLKDLLHEIGHILIEDGHSEKHKKIILELYDLWKQNEF